MTKEERQIVYNARILTMLADMLDLHLCNLEESVRNAGAPWRGKVKSRTDAFRKCIASLRNLFLYGKTEEEKLREAEVLGNDVDRLYAITLLILDRCGDNKGKNHEYQLFNMIKNTMPSRLEYDLAEIERNAFMD